jgi:malic enzyme
MLAHRRPAIEAHGWVRSDGEHAEPPVAFRPSNPTSRSEATPQQLLEWTDGRALIGTGTGTKLFGVVDIRLT